MVFKVAELIVDGIGRLEPVVLISLSIVDGLQPVVVAGVHLAIGGRFLLIGTGPAEAWAASFETCAVPWREVGPKSFEMTFITYLLTSRCVGGSYIVIHLKVLTPSPQSASSLTRIQSQSESESQAESPQLRAHRSGLPKVR